MASGGVCTGRQHAGEHVNAGAIEGMGIFQRAGETGSELGFPPGQCGNAAFTGIPITGRCIEQHLLQAMGLQACRQLFHGKGVWKQKLHPREAVGRSSGKSVQKGVLVVEQRKVGGKAGHSRESVAADRGMPGSRQAARMAARTTFFFTRTKPWNF